VNKDVNGLLLETDPFEPEGGGISSFGVNYLILNYNCLAELPPTDISSGIAEFLSTGLIIKSEDKDYYSVTRKGKIARIVHLAEKKKLQPALREQNSYNTDDLILALLASNKIDGWGQPTSFTESGIGIYLHQHPAKNINDAITILLDKGFMATEAPFRNDWFRITGSGLQYYLSTVRQKLGLDSDTGILTPVTEEYINDKIFNLPNLQDHIKENLNSRWSEIEKCAFSEAWLASVIMLGSLLEGVLLAVLEAAGKKALDAVSAPKNRKSGDVKPIDTWTLQDYIKVAIELRIIPSSIEKHIHELRDTRNLVHPNKQLRENIIADESLYRISREVTETIIDALQRR
jgi:predicted transcriptional regulator